MLSNKSTPKNRTRQFNFKFQSPYQDYLVINQTTLQYDTQQDWTVVNCTEENGTTIIVICRAKNTSDANDTAVQVGLLTFQKDNVFLYIVARQTKWRPLSEGLERTKTSINAKLDRFNEHYQCIN